jgi:hypothetical protein
MIPFFYPKNCRVSRISLGEEEGMTKSQALQVAQRYANGGALSRGKEFTLAYHAMSMRFYIDLVTASYQLEGIEWIGYQLSFDLSKYNLIPGSWLQIQEYQQILPNSPGAATNVYNIIPNSNKGNVTLVRILGQSYNGYACPVFSTLFEAAPGTPPTPREGININCPSFIGTEQIKFRLLEWGEVPLPKRFRRYL